MRCCRSACAWAHKPAGNWGGAHATCIDPSSPDVGELSRGELTTRTSFSYGVSVNRDGQAFLRRVGTGRRKPTIRMGKAVLKQPDQTVHSEIFDQNAVGLIDPQYKTQAPIVAETLDELADKCGINATRAQLRNGARIQRAAIDASKRFDPNVKDGRAASSAFRS